MDTYSLVATAIVCTALSVWLGYRELRHGRRETSLVMASGSTIISLSLIVAGFTETDATTLHVWSGFAARGALLSILVYLAVRGQYR